MSSQAAGSQVRNTVVYLLTIVTAQAAAFALLPLITRFLGPDSYGEYSLALAVSGLVGTMASTWIRNVAFRYYFDERAAGSSRTFYWSLVLMQATAVLLVFLATSFVLPHVGLGVISGATLWSAAAVVLTGDFHAMTLAFVRAEQRSGRYAVAELTAAATRLAGTAAGLLIGLDSPSFLLLAAAAASALGGAVAYHGLAPKLLGPGGVAWRPIGAVSRHVLGAMPFSVGEWVGTLSDRLVLNAFAGTAAVGIYSAGFSLGDRVIGGLVMAVFMMAWPDVLGAYSDGGHSAARVAVRRYFQIYLWLTVGPLVVLLLFGGTVVGLLGAAYSEALQVIGLVSVAAWLRGLGTGFNRHFELEKRFYALSLITVGGSAANLALNLWLVPRHGALGAGIAALATQLLLATTFVLTRDRRLVSFPFADLVALVPATVAAAFALKLGLGDGLPALFLFAGAYAVLTLAVWGARLRGGRSAGAA